MQIYVITITCKTITLKVEGSDSIQQVKQMVENGPPMIWLNGRSREIQVSQVRYNKLLVEAEQVTDLEAIAWDKAEQQ